MLQSSNKLLPELASIGLDSLDAKCCLCLCWAIRGSNMPFCHCSTGSSMEGQKNVESLVLFVLFLFLVINLLCRRLCLDRRNCCSRLSSSRQVGGCSRGSPRRRMCWLSRRCRLLHSWRSAMENRLQKRSLSEGSPRVSLREKREEETDFFLPLFSPQLLSQRSC